MPEKDALYQLDPDLLKPFHGYQSSLLPLSSGHYIYLTSWDSTPTPYETFSNLWLVTPEDRRILFADPLGAASIVTLYHDFHQIQGASIQMKWTAPDQIRVVCESEDARTRLTASLVLKETFRSRLLLKLGAGPPSRTRLSKPVIRLSNFLCDLLVARGNTCLLGWTETGQPFYHGETEILYLVQGGGAELNGQDLGNFTNRTWDVHFGDGAPFDQPVLKIGTLYIPYPKLDLST